MTVAALSKSWFFNRCRFLAPPDDSAGGELPAVPESDFSAEELAYLPGGELLEGASGKAPKPPDALPDWTEENAAGEEDDIAAVPAAAADDDATKADDAKDATKDATKTPEPVAEALEVPTVEEMAEWPEEARLFAERVIAREAAGAAELETLRAAQTTLAAELETAKKAQPAALPPAPVGANPLFHTRDLKALDFHADLADRLAEWATDYATTGGEMPADLEAAFRGVKVADVTEAKFFDDEEVKEIRSRAKQMLKTHIPSQREYLKDESEAIGYLREHHPSYIDPKSEDGKLFAAFSEQAGGMRSNARWPVILADTVRGYKARIAEETAKLKAKQTPAPTLAPKPPVVTRPAGTAPKISKPVPAKSKLSASMTPAEMAAAQ